MLDIESPVAYDGTITGIEFHNHKPYASSTFKVNDEIRIPLFQPDVITAPYESFLHVTGKVSGEKADKSAAVVALVNNAIAHLFTEIRLEVNGVEIDRTKNVGITSTMKNLLSVKESEAVGLKNAMWLGPGETIINNEFSCSVPLKMLLGFAEDYKKVVCARQELVLLRSSTDNNAVLSADAAKVAVKIEDIYWRVPHITVSDSFRLKLMGMFEADTLVHLPFRTWELYTYPSLPQTTRQSWTIKTSTLMEKPRFVVFGLQNDRVNQIKKNASLFDPMDVTDVTVYLNTKPYPYEKVHGDTALFYEMGMMRFQNSYYGGSSQPSVSLEKFKTDSCLYVIDCSYQKDDIRTGSVDIRIEFEAKNAFPANVAAYALLIHDAHYAYTLLTGSVKKMW